jgi:hypothetical protein
MEFGGCLERISVEAERSEAQVLIDGLPLRFESLFAAFDEATSTDSELKHRWDWEVAKQGDIYCLDLVIYAGERKTIDFQTLNRAAFIFSLAIGEEVEKLPLILVEEETDQVTDLHPVKAEREASCISKDRQSVRLFCIQLGEQHQHKSLSI